MGGIMGKRKRILILFLLLSFLLMAVLLPGTVVAQDGNQPDLTITLDDAVNKALSYTHQLDLIDQSIKTMWKQSNDLMTMGNGLQQQLDVHDRYQNLYDKKRRGEAMDASEQMTLQAYQAAFGPTPSQITLDDRFYNYVKVWDFPQYALWGSIQNLKTGKEVRKNGVVLLVRQLFDNIVNLQESLALQKELYDTKQKQYAQLIVKYNQGQASELDKYTSDVELQQLKLNIVKMQRSIDNLKMYLKQQTGLTLTQKIILKADDLKPADNIKPYEEYLNKALANRSEIVNAKMDLQVKQRELDIMKKYIWDEKMPDRQDAQHSVDEKTNALTEAVNSVTNDIKKGYADVNIKKKDTVIAQDKVNNAEKQYKDNLFRYEKGLIPITVLWSLETALTSAKIGYNSSIRDFNSAVYKLELASGIGPGYNTQMGGK